MDCQICWLQIIVFTSDTLKNFTRCNRIRHVTLAPYHPASNRLAERAVQTFKEFMKKKTSVVSLETCISHFLFQYSITPHTTNGMSPAQLLLSWHPHSHLDLPDILKHVQQRQQTQKIDHDKKKQREGNFKLVNLSLSVVFHLGKVGFLDPL